MKKLFSILSIAVLAAACAKEPVPTPDPTPVIEKVHVEFSANLEDTKATISQMKWEEGDKITIWVKSALDKAIYEGDVLNITNIETGTFEGEIASPNPAGDTFYTAYNASGIQAVGETYVPVFNIPAVQNTAAAGATKAMLKGEFTGVKENIHFTMKAATAKLKITVTEGVSKVVFAGMNDEIIASGSKTLTYAGSAATDVEFIVPAMTFTNGYKVTYTNSRGTMYQSYSGEKSFVAGTERTINCTFVPFSISCEIVDDQKPMTSYDYYLAGDLATANSAAFETEGRLSESPTEDPWTYDEDAQGIFTGKIKPGKAKVVVSGISKTFLSGYKIKEYGYYVQRVGGHSGKDVIAKDLNLDLVDNKNITWDVLIDPNNPTKWIEVDAGEIVVTPYIVINDGTADNEYTSVSGYSFHVTGLPHISNHKDLWYVCTQGTGAAYVSGSVERHQDEEHYNVDMFRAKKTDSWTDFSVRTREFHIPAATNAQVIMHGTLWAPHSIYSYFWFDETNNTSRFVFHKDVTKGDEQIDKSLCDAWDEEKEARLNESYYDLGTDSYDPHHSGVNNNVVTLSPTYPAVSIYMWIHRGSTAALDYVGYWCRYIKVQYATPSGN